MRTFSILFVIFLFCPFASKSQEEQKIKKNEFKLDIFSFIGSTFYAEYERSISENNSLNIVIAPTALDNNEKKMLGIYVQANPKFYYLAGKNEHSEHFLYFSPFAAYRYFEIMNSYSDYTYPYGYQYPGVFVPVKNNFNANSAGAGVLFGYKIIAGNFLIINIEAGGGMKYVFNKAGNCDYSDVNGGYNNWNLGYSGIFPKFGFTLGFKF